MKKITKLSITVMSILLFVFLATVIINLYMSFYAREYIYDDVKNIPEKYTVIVPGAKVYSNNVSFVVRDRIAAAADCVKNQKAERVLISGDHGKKNYDEVNQMRKYMQNVYGIDGSIIFMDHAGFSTYETMYRAKEIFCVDNAVVVTQKFHTVRSVYIARKLGMDVVAYEAPELNPFSRRVHLSWNIREYLARVKSFFLVLTNANPTYLGEKIPITGNSRDSWDLLE